MTRQLDPLVTQYWTARPMQRAAGAGLSRGKSFRWGQNIPPASGSPGTTSGHRDADADSDAEGAQVLYSSGGTLLSAWPLAAAAERWSLTCSAQTRFHHTCLPKYLGTQVHTGVTVNITNVGSSPNMSQLPTTRWTLHALVHHHQPHFDMLGHSSRPNATMKGLTTTKHAVLHASHHSCGASRGTLHRSRRETSGGYVSCDIKYLVLFPAFFLPNHYLFIYRQE